ncbi:threonine synthase [Clostridium rectalis]|uniref:threonine synthase n=1 Tax=Clostridium rectalis TaxID=2040295 RepID=UPI000F630BEF|nr:threonine synthase [Clostridium rectalis]
MKNLKMYCTNCKREYPIQHVHPRCMLCNEPLEVQSVSQGKIKEGNPLTQTILERYSDFFPFNDINNDLSLNEGFTSLVSSKKLASKIGIKNIYFKNESENPTWSFKDRGTLLGIQHAYSLGYKKVGAVSTGNMAVSVAAYGKRAGFETFILVSKTIPEEKLNPVAIYGANLIKVDGDYGNLYYESLKIGEKQGIYFINSDVTYRVEGSKTIAFEICEQLKYDVPEYVIVPTSAGGNIRGILKGFEEFKQVGIINKIPKMICAQAAGCSPIYNAFIKNTDTVKRVIEHETIAHGIENPFPPSGNQVLRKLRKNGGICISVTDEEIINAQKELAQEGIFGQPESAVPLASIKKLKKQGFLKETDSVACVVTGSGLKYTKVFEKHNLKAYECNIEKLNFFIRNNFK